MSPEILEAITLEWNNTTSDAQKQLIARYLSRFGQDNNGDWMNFLKQQFGLSGNDSGAPEF